MSPKVSIDKTHPIKIPRLLEGALGCITAVDDEINACPQAADDYKKRIRIVKNAIEGLVQKQEDIQRQISDSADSEKRSEESSIRETLKATNWDTIPTILRSMK